MSDIKQSNQAIVGEGFRFLLEALAPYIAMELQRSYGNNWWNDGVLAKLYEDQCRDLPRKGEWAALVDSLDIQRALILFADANWNEVFKKKLSSEYRSWAKELTITRNKWAHAGGEDFNENDTWRALDTMARLIEQIDEENAEIIRGLLRKSRYGSEGGSTSVTENLSQQPARERKNTGILTKSPDSALKGWREVMEPHPDVAQGRYRNAEFAADLAQVARGEGSIEYRDPVEFFGRTYVTEGMKGLLAEALERVCGMEGGEPVIQLKTAFGGGKTHSMLALYHMLRGTVPAEKIPAIKPVLDSLGLTSIPKANVAVLVGTALDPTKNKRPANLPGVTINTLWGEIAAQLALSSGKPEIYDIIKESDKKGVAPGSEVLKNLLDACGPCLVLIDELVAYAKKIYGVDGLPAGSFDNLISFIQEITEAAKASKNSLVVASIPESTIEIGGEAGKIALETIEHTFGRMESIWKPVAASEGFEVVRRRLFLDCKDPEAREAVCSAFSRMYNDYSSDFPIESKELTYRDRMISCYPIHPEIFDRLYEDWASLERFQRTRGVLRLMASVIHELWMGNDEGLMIMPGSVPLDVPSVRDELTRHLDEGWNSVVDTEVDSKNSEPYRKDKNNSRYGKLLAMRRVARTIMLGSAPSARDASVRGIEASRVRLGVVQAGEDRDIAVFNDALGTLASSLSYLYQNQSGDRFWYDTRPTLRKLVSDRAANISKIDVEYEIEKRLKKTRKEAPFAGVHVCPVSSLDVPDEQAARLVVLPPEHLYKNGDDTCAAIVVVNDMLNNRGTSPRIYRNMITFVAPGQDTMSSLKQEVQQYLAWESVAVDKESLNLDTAQMRQVDSSLKRSSETVEMRIQETYHWLLVPYIDRSGELKTVHWDAINIAGGSDSIVTKAAKKMAQNEALISKWAPALLLMELDNLLWNGDADISIKKLWEQLCTYCYLPRLASFSVLEDAIRVGVSSDEYFGYAAMVADGHYVDLRLGEYLGMVDASGLLVKLSVAKEQKDAEAKAAEEKLEIIVDDNPNASRASDGVEPADSNYAHITGTDLVDGNAGASASSSAPSAPNNTRFYMTAKLDLTRINRDVQNIVEEIIRHIAAEDGIVDVSLEVNAEIAGGISPQTVRAVSENCKTLKITDFGFDR